MRISPLVVVFALVSCASVDNYPSETLYKEYLEYKELANSDNETAVSTKISKEYLGYLNESDRNIPPELGLTTPFWKYLAGEIRTEYSHFEKIEGETGCLTINGLDKLDRPGSLSLYYIKEDGNWVFNYFGIAVHKSIREYYTEPTCPSLESLKGES
jgi:hypothetical protein